MSDNQESRMPPEEPGAPPEPTEAPPAEEATTAAGGAEPPPDGGGAAAEGASAEPEPEPDAVPAGEPEDRSHELRLVEVRDLDWGAVHAAAAAPFDDARAERIIRRMEDRLQGGGPLGLAFEEHAAGDGDRALHVARDPGGEVWFVGDLHGDLLALEAALRVIGGREDGEQARIVFLGDLFDDGGAAVEVVLRIFELILDRPHWRVTVVAGNHDEALAYDGDRFHSSVIPSDFTDWLNAHRDHPWATRLGRVIVGFFERAPRAIFLPDGLLVAHGGVPHTDLLEELEETGNWNDPRLLQDFVWLRAHPRARKRLPNRTTRGSEFGREDFAAFCATATRLGRPVSRMIRGHDHIEERFAVYYPESAHPLLTINTMSRRLPREVFGDYERAPAIARWVRGELPEVHRLIIPPELIHEVYPTAGTEGGGR